MAVEKAVLLNTGQLMPSIGLGTSNKPKDLVKKSLQVALDCGYRSVDTAFMYKNEDAIGEELRDWFSTGKLKREEVFVSSKLPAIGNRKSDVRKFLTKSLERLQLEYLDLYLIHHPFGLLSNDEDNLNALDANGRSKFDPDMDIEGLWKVMEEQVDAGLVKAIGVSNFNSEQIDRIFKVARIQPSVNQVEAHAYMQQSLLNERCEKLGVVLVAYSPLGAPYTEEGANASPALIDHPLVSEIAASHSKTIPQVLLRFLIQKNFVAIPNSTNPKRIKENFEVFDFSLSEEEMSSLSQLDRGNKGRVYNFQTHFPGIEHHKEYPFHIPF